jgi:hypothetical protein
MSPRASGSVLPCSLESSRARLFDVLLDELQEFHQHAGAALRVRRSPGGLRGRGIGDRCLHLGGGERHVGLHVAGVGIEHVTERAADVPRTWLPPMKWVSSFTLRLLKESKEGWGSAPGPR